MITETLRLVPTSESWELQRRHRTKKGDWSQWTGFAWYPKAEQALDRIAREAAREGGFDAFSTVDAIFKAAEKIRDIRAQLETDSE